MKLNVDNWPQPVMHKPVSQDEYVNQVKRMMSVCNYTTLTELAERLQIDVALLKSRIGNRISEFKE